MANKTIHLDIDVAFDLVNTLQVVYRDLFAKLDAMNKINIAMQDVYQGDSARDLEQKFLDSMKNIGNSHRRI